MCHRAAFLFCFLTFFALCASLEKNVTVAYDNNELVYSGGDWQDGGAHKTGDSVSLVFNGTAVYACVETGPNKGDLSVSVDSQIPTTVDPSTPGFNISCVYHQTGLDPLQPHIINLTLITAIPKDGPVLHFQSFIYTINDTFARTSKSSRNTSGLSEDQKIALGTSIPFGVLTTTFGLVGIFLQWKYASLSTWSMKLWQLWKRSTEPQENIVLNELGQG